MNSLWKKNIYDEFTRFSRIQFSEVKFFSDIFKMNISKSDKDDKDYTSNNQQLKCNFMNFSDNSSDNSSSKSSSSIEYNIEDKIIE